MKKTIVIYTKFCYFMTMINGDSVLQCVSTFMATYAFKDLADVELNPDSLEDIENGIPVFKSADLDWSQAEPVVLGLDYDNKVIYEPVLVLEAHKISRYPLFVIAHDRKKMDINNQYLLIRDAARCVSIDLKNLYNKSVRIPPHIYEQFLARQEPEKDHPRLRPKPF